MQEQHIDDSRSVLQKKRWRELLGGNQIPNRVILALSFLIFFDLFSAFSRSAHGGPLRWGQKAPPLCHFAKPIFSFLDEEATRTLKQEAVRDIGGYF